MKSAFIPSPSTGVIHLGSVPLRGYAFCIIIGVFVAVWYGNKRWIARGGKSGTVADIAIWAVPFGLVGGRLYHVITDPELYFEHGEDWVNAFKVWQGGLGIWGAIALGAVGAWIACRRRGIPLPAWVDALAPAVAIAQAIGRWGNWFNQELYGRKTDLPWALHITQPPEAAGYYHPTFLYESIWCLIVAAVVVWADRRFTLGHGRVFALYVALYCLGRGGTEYLRVDDANHILGLRLNLWTVMIVFILAVVYVVLSARMRPGREEIVEPESATGDGGDPAVDGAKSDGTKSSGTKSPGTTSDGAKSAGAKTDGDKTAGDKTAGDKTDGKKSTGTGKSGTTDPESGGKGKAEKVDTKVDRKTEKAGTSKPATPARPQTAEKS